ncbi:MAG: peptide chain release factor aRF-1 [Candidatus Aenigmarchaeota archaeon]|nr:peptide chain release factor aRF-1 [Candidatus Aenigmarchaeota archaeon]
MSAAEEEKMAKMKLKLKKLVRELARIRGRHTELVSVYVPAGYNINEIMSQLRSEQSTAENIKSKPVRKNVTTALEKIMRHLQLYKSTPASGLALFCGNVSDQEGKENMEMWAIEPPEPVKVKMYWCDQKFVTEPLEDMIAEKEIYGIINLDRSEADIALLVGKKIEPLVHFESIVPGKTRAGGQSSARFSRVREGLLNDWLKQVAEAANKIFMEKKEVIGVIVSGPGPVKDMFLKEDYLFADVKNRVIGTVDTSYTGEFGVDETIQRGAEIFKEAAVMKEKKILERFFTELQKPYGLAVYGFEQVRGAIEAGAVDYVILSESLEARVFDFTDETGAQKTLVYVIGKEVPPGFSMGSSKDIVEYFEDKAISYGSRVELVSRDTREGEQFLQLGGIGAILRYRVS